MSHAGFPYERWSAWIDRHRRGIFSATAVLCICAAALSYTRLRLDADVLGMLPAGRPAFDDFKFFVADFGELNELTVLIEGGSLDELKNFGDAFGSRLAELDIVRSVHVRTDVDAVREGILSRRLYNYLPVAAYDRLAQRLTREGIAAQVRADREILSAPFDLEAARAVARDPLGLVPLAAEQLAGARGKFLATDPAGYVVAPDQTALLIFVEPRESAFDIYFSEELMREVQAAEVATRRALPMTAVRVAYTGSVLTFW
jgi:predicted exporter